jgi:hypothetical protein
MSEERRDGGYILAAVLISMLVLGALATGLSLLAIHELRRVRDHETRLVEDGLLHAAVAFTAAELAREPETRSVRFDDARDTLNIDGREVAVQLAWESHKVDLNAASRDLIIDQAAVAGLVDTDRALLLSRIDNLRANHLEVRLLDDIVADGFASPGCVRAAFTVFGGRRREADPIVVEGVFDRPTPGTRIAMVVRLVPDGRVASAVVLMTGDPVDPARIQDWRWRDSRHTLPCAEGG